MADNRVMRHIPQTPRKEVRSCTKHGRYTGPYCPACYEKAMGSSGSNDGEATRDNRNRTTSPQGSIQASIMDRFDEELKALRRDKDSFFRNDVDSPIPSEHRSAFKGLNYYPPDQNYRVSARLSRFDDPEPVVIATSTGTSQACVKYGTFRFEVEGTRLELQVYKSAEDPFAMSLFVPFSDTTSGSETYSSGRYLDLEEQGGDEYELDFNHAYNPYCAYNVQYTCPIPPRENRLPIKILAGEKNYK